LCRAAVLHDKKLCKQQCVEWCNKNKPRRFGLHVRLRAAAVLLNSKQEAASVSRPKIQALFRWFVEFNLGQHAERSAEGKTPFRQG
jgi:hypothetical protein